jgi:biotin carboxyl carrier protein
LSDTDKFHQIELENGVFETRLTRKYALRKPFEKHDPRIIKAIIPGVVAEIHTKVGTLVQQGDTMMILEAMKMLNRIVAPENGRIKVIRVAQGEKVDKGQVLLEIE